MSELSEILGLPVAEDENTPRERLERTRGNALAQIAFNLSWRCENAQHSDTFIARKFNFWRDILPPELEMDLLDRPRGHTASHRYAPGELLARPTSTDLRWLPGNAFRRDYHKGLYVEPRAGRFYPRGFIAGTADIFPGDVRPFRVAEVEDERLRVDLAHPLAGRELELSALIQDIWAASEEHGGRCDDVAELVSNNGPGMQARWHGRPTDFFSDIPFMRPAPEPDAAFYALPRMLNHVDTTASAQIRQLYARLLPPGARVLDLMSSRYSHLPEGFTGEVVGLGMNAEEMQANPVLASSQVQDLNLQPGLPWGDASFDAAVCSLSVEYLTRPFEVFAELARVLRPGAPLAISFSDRWFPPKVTRLWEGAHPFERPGIVLEYFLRDGLFGGLHTLSVRGLPRPPDDPHAAQRVDADPVFAVWGYRN